MIRQVELSAAVRKRIARLPLHVVIKFQDWVEDVERRGVEEVRKIPGYHDEPLRGRLAGYRSIRLSKSYRAYYKVLSDKVKFIYVERIDKHEY